VTKAQAPTEKDRCLASCNDNPDPYLTLPYHPPKSKLPTPFSEEPNQGHIRFDYLICLAP
jgi:hypothetical protein